MKAKFSLPQNNIKAKFYSGGQSGEGSYATKYELITETNNRIDADEQLSIRIGAIDTLIIEKSDKFEQDITDINNTLSNFGNIVSHNVDEFATASQGRLAETALQPNDNISKLTNDVGFITVSALNGYATENWVGQQGYLTSSDLSGYATELWVNNQGFIKGINNTDVINALGYTPYNSSNPSGFITNVVNDLANYYLKTETYTKQEVNQLIQAIPKFTVVIVQTLPQTGEELKLYLVPKDGASPDVYNEYIWIEDNRDYELIGNTAIDLTDYVTKTELSTTLGNYALSSSIPTKTSDLTNDSGFITLSALTGYATENFVISQGYITASAIGNGTVTINQGGSLKGTFTLNQSGNVTIDLDAGGGGSTPSNMVTTDTTQDISGRKTFLGEKAIFFKQQETSNKLGFTLYNPSNVELGALEYRPNTIGSASLLALNCPQTTGGYVGFRYWGTPAVNIVAPKVATAGNYYMTTHITNGSTTVTANNAGLINISTLIPTIATSVNSGSTNAQTVGAKLFYDTVGNIETLLSYV